MNHYSILVTFHIIFAGMWLIFFAADIILKRQINKSVIGNTKEEFISLYLKFTNLFGIVGSVGIAVTGIILVVLNPVWGFFDMSHAHWLATKQIIFIVILVITFAKMIPTSRKLRTAILDTNDSQIDKQFSAITKLNKVVTILVILNFIFAVTRNLY
ncbi:MAG: hypothetical protein CR986_06575 [Ignavibacteriae bacterium]|nr:MAG: hypothetical protein CR986_06575 [Ignavibacteriota bacterium]